MVITTPRTPRRRRTPRRFAARTLCALLTLTLALALAAPASAQTAPPPQRWYETWLLEPPLGNGDQLYGWDVALSGTTALVGAPGASGPIGGSFGAGSAFVYVLDGTSWVLEQELETPLLFSQARFGEAVALDGDTAAVGLPVEPVGVQPEQGGVAVFARSGTTWTLQGYLPPPDLQPTSLRFGHALALSGDTLAIGAPGAEENGAAGAGAVYVYTRTAGLWSQQARLVSPAPQPGSAFGTDVDVDGDTLLVGEPYTETSPSLTQGGAGRVYQRVGGAWSFQQTLLSLDQAAFDFTGTCVALDGTRAVIGSPGPFSPGELTTFEKIGPIWVADELLFDLSSAMNGRAVALSGDTVVTGTRIATSDGLRPGARPFVVVGGTWAYGPPAWGRDGLTGEGLTAVSPTLALDGDLLLVGVPRHDGVAVDAGRVHVFTRDGPWTDLGHALQGAFPTPLLYGAGPLSPSSHNELLVAGTPGGALAVVIASVNELSLPFKGGVLVPAPDVIVGPIDVPDLPGDATVLALDLPPGLPAGLSVAVQHWMPDPQGPAGWAAGNGLRATVP